jgi:hypothetical protein
MVSNLANKFGIPKVDYNEFKKLHYIIEYLRRNDPNLTLLSTRSQIEYCEKVMKAETYIQKAILVSEYIPLNERQKTMTDSKEFWE